MSHLLRQRSEIFGIFAFWTDHRFFQDSWAAGIPIWAHLMTNSLHVVYVALYGVSMICPMSIYCTTVNHGAKRSWASVPTISEVAQTPLYSSSKILEVDFMSLQVFSAEAPGDPCFLAVVLRCFLQLVPSWWAQGLLHKLSPIWSIQMCLGKYVFLFFC